MISTGLGKISDVCVEKIKSNQPPFLGPEWLRQKGHTTPKAIQSDIRIYQISEYVLWLIVRVL